MVVLTSTQRLQGGRDALPTAAETAALLINPSLRLRRRLNQSAVALFAL